MRLKSRGLGRKELVMDFREYEVVREGKEILIVGTIRDPVNWEFSIRLSEDDIPGITRLATRFKMLSMLLRSAFNRKRHHHWSDDQSDHVAGAAARRTASLEKFHERARAERERESRSRRRQPSSAAG